VPPPGAATQPGGAKGLDTAQESGGQKGLEKAQESGGARGLDVAREAGPDFALNNGRFFTQARGNKPQNFGFAMRDREDCPCYRKFEELGGVSALGFPASRAYRAGPFVYQATQRALLQWDPAAKKMNFANVFDLLAAQGKDDWLESFKQIPKSFDWASDQGKTFEEILRNHVLQVLEAAPGEGQGLVVAKQAIREKMMANPAWIDHYGLPMAIKDYGPVVVVRAQRAAFQYWKEDVPWAKAGEVTMVLGGDIAKEAGLVPPEAGEPEEAPAE